MSRNHTQLKSREEKLQRAVAIARQLHASKSTITLTTLSKRVGTATDAVRKALREADLEHVLSSTAG